MRSRQFPRSITQHSTVVSTRAKKRGRGGGEKSLEECPVSRRRGVFLRLIGRRPRSESGFRVGRRGRRGGGGEWHNYSEIWLLSAKCSVGRGRRRRRGATNSPTKFKRKKKEHERTGMRREEEEEEEEKLLWASDLSHRSLNNTLLLPRRLEICGGG